MSLLMFMVNGKSPKLGELRGRQVFDAIQATIGGFDISAPDEQNNIRIGQGTVFADAGNLNVAPLIDNVRKRGGRVILDVHFPVFDLDRLNAFQPDVTDEDRDLELDVQVRQYWSDPQNRIKFFDMLEAADAVTYCRPEWGKELWRFNANSYLLPDVHDFESAMNFARVWFTLVADLTQPRPKFVRLRRWAALNFVRPALSKQFKDAGE